MRRCPFNNFEKLLNKLIGDAKANKITGDYSHQCEVRPNSNDSFDINTDCSGLVTYMLRTTRPDVYLELNDFIKNVKKLDNTQFKRIFTFDFYDIFKKIQDGSYRSKSLKQISDLHGLKKGDIVVYLPPLEQRKRHGHMGIVSSNQVKKVTDNIISVEIIHSSSIIGMTGLSKLHIEHTDGNISGISYDSPHKLTPCIGLAGRLTK